MKKSMRRVVTLLLAFVIVLASVGTAKFDSEAASKLSNGKYTFSPCNCSKFNVKNKKMTIKLKGSTFLKNNDVNTGKKNVTIPVAKNCKYYVLEFNFRNGNQKIYKSNYKSIKKRITGDRMKYKRLGFCSNRGMTAIVIKKGKIVKVTYNLVG